MKVRGLSPSVRTQMVVALLLLVVVLTLGPLRPTPRGIDEPIHWREILFASATGLSVVAFLGSLPVYLFSKDERRAASAGEIVKGLLSFFIGVLTAGLAS